MATFEKDIRDNGKPSYRVTTKRSLNGQRSPVEGQAAQSRSALSLFSLAVFECGRHR
ncbi:MAG: hypothetical protein HOI95_14125 [Chromatiales bacterium]|nr:hypothetical protein [Chromatiales bacterium]